MKSNDVVLALRKMEATTFATMLLVSLVLNLIVAVGNWQLYSRARKLETILGLGATPQLQQKPSSKTK